MVPVTKKKQLLVDTSINHLLSHHLLVSDDLDFCTTGWMVNDGKTMKKIPMIDAEITTLQPCSWFNQHMFFPMGNPT